MYLTKRIFAVLLLAVFALGFGAGFGGGYWKYVHAPLIKAREAAKKMEEELNKMARHGEAVEVKPDAITLRVEKGGGDVGQTITARVSEHTTVQVGMGVVSRYGEKPDLTKWFRPGDRVDVLYRDGQALALHREPKPGEQVPQVPQQVQGPPAPAPQAQQQGGGMTGAGR